MKIFCITLPERPSDTDLVAAHFAERGLHDVNYITGIDAEKFGLRTEHTYDFDNPGTNYHIGPKDVGLFLSHYMTWVACSVSSDDLFMICEADARFVEDWQDRLNKIMMNKLVGDQFLGVWSFDMMYLGSCHCLDKPKKQLDGDIWDVKYPLCTHAYMVTRKGIEILLRTQRDCYGSIDCALMQRSLPEMRVLTILPRLADQHKWNDTSDHALKWK